jgi:hypothetical protein
LFTRFLFRGYFEKKQYFCGGVFTAKKDNAMVIEVDKTVTPAQLRQLLENMKSARSKASRQNLSEFFGALPSMGDGLKFQEMVRNEWNCG